MKKSLTNTLNITWLATTLSLSFFWMEDKGQAVKLNQEISFSKEVFIKCKSSINAVFHSFGFSKPFYEQLTFHRNDGLSDFNFVLPPPAEICNNGIDDDADGLVDVNDPDCGTDATVLVPSGSFIINMGVQPQTVGNAIKPYGLVWHLLHDHEIPIFWVINPNKMKDGVDFSHNGVDYKGGPFIISAEYRTPAVDALIAAWQANGVVGATTVADITVPVERVLNYSMNWTLDLDNGQIAQAYLDRAGIPETAYNWTLPQNLNCCTDVFLIPHSEPVWDTHNQLLAWNASPAQGGCAGSIWAGCKAGSEVENIKNPANPSQRLNFLMLPPVAPATSPAVWSDNHADGSLPYNYDFPTHPIMQFMGTMDGAQENGAEQIYLPTNAWRPTTYVGVWDPTHPNVPSLSPGKAAKLAFGPAFGDNTRGYVMYQTAHRLDKADAPSNLAAQRAFLNFSFMAVGQKAIHVTADIPDNMESGNTYLLTASASGGSGAYLFKWETDCGGTFSNPFSANTTYTPPNVLSQKECYIKVLVTDNCGTRVGFQNVYISLRPRPQPPVAVDDYEETLPGVEVIVNALVNDSDPNLDPLTLSALIGPTNTGNGIFVNNGNNTVTYTPNFNFIGVDQINYKVCDNTPLANGGPLCDTATIFITVDWSDANGCLPNQYYGVTAQGNATAVLAQNSITNPTQALGVPVLVSSSNSYYAKLDNDADYLVLDLGYNMPVGDTIWLHIGSDDGAPATLRVTGTLSSTNYATETGFYDLNSYTTNKDLNNAVPQEDVVAYVPATGAVRRLRFTRATGAGKPCINGVRYVDKNCLSAVPVANPDAVTICEDHTEDINVLANDSDPQDLPLTVSIVTPPAKGIVAVSSEGIVTYKPNTDVSGTDNFVYRACNSKDLCGQATVTITITDDSCPIEQYATSGTSGNAVSVFSSANTTNAAYATGSPNNAGASISANAGNLVLDLGTTVATGSTVKVYLKYQTTDWSSLPNAIVSGGTAGAGPFTNPVTYSTTSSFVAYNYNVSQADGVRYIRIAASAPSGNPSDQYIHVDAVQFTDVSGGGCSGGCQSIPTYPPDAVNDFATTYLNTPVKIAVQTNDLDPSGFGLTTYLGFSNPPDNGTVMLDGNVIRYVPNSGYVGTDVFNYKICNPYGCDSALVTVNVLCVDPEDGRAIQGMVFNDQNYNATFNPGEPGIGNIRVRLYKDTNSNGQYNAGEPQLDSALTDSQGNYSFFLGNGNISNSTSTVYYANSATGALTSGQFSYVTGAPNGTFVKLGKEKYVVLQFANIIPFGTTVSIYIAGDKKKSRATVTGSLDGSSFLHPLYWVPSYTSDQGNPPPASAIEVISYQVAAPGGINFLKIERTAENVYVDAASWKQVTSTGGGVTIQLSRTISSSVDDAEEEGPDGSNLGPGSMLLHSSDLELTQDLEAPSSGTQKIGLRFNNINIPQGVTITNAALKFKAISADSPMKNSGATSLTIKGQAADDAATFANATNNISDRPLTTASVAWNLSAWSTGTVYSSPNLSAIVQEIVNRPGWAMGNNMAFVITGTGSRSTNSYDGSPSDAPVLEITYTTGSSADNGHFVIRLDPITFPPNSTLTTDNLETAVVLNNGDVDCSNNFGLIDHLPPIANPDTAYADAGTTININIVNNDSDPEGTSLTLTVLTNPPFGTAVNNNNGTLNFTPNIGFLGWQTFTYKACDAGTPVLCDTTTVSVLTSPFVNDPPVAQDDYDTTVVNKHVETSVLLNDFDQEFGVLTVSLSLGIQQPSNGTVEVVNGKQIEYAPNPGFTGNDQYQYIVCDDQASPLCDTARVFIHVKNQPPDARPDYVQTSVNVPLSVQVLNNDIEPDGHAIVLMSSGSNSPPTNGSTLKGGTVVISTNGTPFNYADDFINYTPPAGFTGLDTFYYRIRDVGTPNGYDVTFVEVNVTPLIDLELSKTVNPAISQINQNVTFTLTLTNKGPSSATTILTIDKLTSSYQYLSDNGAGMYDPLTGIWNVTTLAVNQSKTLAITAKILNNSALKNITEVVAADQVDIDSSPNNDDGDQSEDDEDSATPALTELCSNGIDDDGDGLTDCADPDCSSYLLANAGPDIEICTGGNATLNASASGGVAPLTYSWSNGLGSGASKTVSPASTTTYTVTVTSSNGCTATDQATVTVLPDPTITTQPAGFTQCVGGNQALSVSATGGTPALLYQWQSSIDNVSFTNVSGATASTYTPPATTAGTNYYRVVISATGNGCGTVISNKATVTVVADPAISSQPANASICFGGSQILSVSASGGTPSLTYQWQSSTNNISFTNISGATSSTYTTPVLTATTYYRVVVSASGNGCGSVTSNTATVTVVADPSITTHPVSASICPGNTHTLSVSASGGSPVLTFQWQSSSDNVAFSDIPGATSASFTTPALFAATYYRVVVSAAANGCGSATSNVATVSMTSISANAGTDPTICSGTSTIISASASGDAAPYTFAWSNSLGSGSSKTVSPASTTTYTVTVTSANGCTATDQVTVNVNPSPIANAGPDKFGCLNQNTNISASASGGTTPYNYAWSHGLGSGATKIVSPLVTTTYTVTVTSGNGCVATDDVVVTIIPCVEICANGVDDDADGLIDCADSDCGPSLDLGTDVSICQGSSITISASGNGGNGILTYLWSHGLGTGNSKTVAPASSTTYSVTVTAPSGCSAVDEKFVAVSLCPEICTDGIDNDNDGLVDCADPDCAGVTAPVLANDSYTSCPGLKFSDRVSDNDGNLQNPTFSIVNSPAHGTVSIDWTGKFTFIPSSFECLTDTFTYEVCNQTSGCCSTAKVIVVLGDTTLPTLINVPPNMVLDCDNAIPSPPVVTAFDQCPGIYIDYEEVFSQNNPDACNEYDITRTWRATDFCGNSVAKSQVISVQDRTKPEIFRVYTLKNGAKLIAGLASNVVQDWKYVPFPITFSQAPIVLTQLTSANDPAPALARQRNVSRQGFQLRLREEDAADGIHASENVAWIAIEPGAFNSPDLQLVAGTFANANHQSDSLSFSPAFAQVPLFFASLQTTNEADPATPRITSLSSSKARFFLQEETSFDPETNHLNETLGFLASSANGILADDKGDVFGEMGTINLTNAWATVSLARKYTKPVIIVSGVSFNDAQPLTVRLRNVSAQSFEVRIEEWAYLDGIHPPETASWMVVEGSLPADIGFYCAGKVSKLQVGANVFVVDNCDNQLSLDYTEAESLLPNGLSTTRSWSATDNCGNNVSVNRLDTCGVAALRLKAILNGAIVNNGGGNLMRDNLRSQNLVPVIEPYSKLPGFPHVVNPSPLITICHQPGQLNQQTMEVPSSELQIHLDHGDVLGACAPLPVALPAGANGATYRSAANGNWTDPATWVAGNVPPLGNVNNATISIEHNVTLLSGTLFLKNNTKLWITNGKLTLAAGNLQLQKSSLIMNNASLDITKGFLYSWTGACEIKMKNCEVKVGNNFSHEAGMRKLEDVCISVGTDFTRGYQNGVSDTLINVTATIHGHFKNYYGGNMHVAGAKFRIRTGDFLNDAGNSITGVGLTLLLENGKVQNNGTWSIPVAHYCVAGTINVPTQYLPIVENCTDIATWFDSCDPFNAAAPAAGGNNTNGGTNNGSNTGTGTTAAVNVSTGVMDPPLLQVTGPAAIVDWMLVELRSADNDKEIIGYATVVMDRNGNVLSEKGDSVILFRGVPEDDYYVVIKHRNHLGMMTEAPYYLSTLNPPLIDFSDPSLPVRGGGIGGRLYLGKRTMWAGDFNEDGKIIYQGPNNDVFYLFSKVLSDDNNVGNLANYVVTGYELQDYNLDGKVIYQGPNNDRAPLLYHSVLVHPTNASFLANFIVKSVLP
jgi:uncharacterized repeat protein (TIGR01451 family)